MRYKIPAIFGAVLLLTGAIVAYQLDLTSAIGTSSTHTIAEQPSNPSSPSGGGLASNDGISDSSLTNEVMESTPNLTNPLLAVRERFEGEHDPMIMFALGEFSDEEIAAYNDLHILPFNPVVGSECNEVESQYVPNSFDTVCTNTRKFPAHPYESLEPEELAELANSDGTAALILAKKTGDADERLKYYLRAAALSDKSGPILTLAEMRFRTFEDLVRDEDKKLKSVPRPDKLITRLALESVAQKMDDPRAMPDLWRQRLQSQPFMEPEEALRRADELADTWVSEIKQIQLNAGVTGKLGGDVDA